MLFFASANGGVSYYLTSICMVCLYSGSDDGSKDREETVEDGEQEVAPIVKLKSISAAPEV